MTSIFGGRNWASINLIGDMDFRKETNERITLFNKFQTFFSGNKSPVANGDPHNETTVSEISADITIDSVKDHTM